MELTVNIKEQSKIASFLNLIKKMDYIEIVDVKEGSEKLPPEHRDLLDKRLLRIKKGETTFKNWDLIKNKYENKGYCNIPYKQKS
jgi:hypothetical protein